MSSMTLHGQSKKEIAEALPRAIKTALLSYQRFTAEEASEDAKSFKAHHDACKVAIAHIELLIKLTQWVGEDAAREGVDDALMSQMIASAQEIQRYEDKYANKE